MRPASALCSILHVGEWTEGPPAQFDHHSHAERGGREAQGQVRPRRVPPVAGLRVGWRRHSS
eukprot:3126813-Prymnesium_polylepis.1